MKIVITDDAGTVFATHFINDKAILGGSDLDLMEAAERCALLADFLDDVKAYGRRLMAQEVIRQRGGES